MHKGADRPHRPGLGEREPARDRDESFPGIGSGDQEAIEHGIEELPALLEILSGGDDHLRHPGGQTCPGEKFLPVRPVVSLQIQVGAVHALVIGRSRHELEIALEGQLGHQPVLGSIAVERVEIAQQQAGCARERRAPHQASKRHAVHRFQIVADSFGRRSRKWEAVLRHAQQAGAFHPGKAEHRAGRAHCRAHEIGDVGRRDLIVVLLIDVEVPSPLPHGPVGVAGPAQAGRLDLHPETGIATRRRKGSHARAVS